LKRQHCRIMSFPKEAPSEQVKNDIHEVTAMTSQVKQIASYMLETAKVMDEVLEKTIELSGLYIRLQKDVMARQDANELRN
jgi:hypothetical protein